MTGPTYVDHFLERIGEAVSTLTPEKLLFRYMEYLHDEHYWEKRLRDFNESRLKEVKQLSERILELEREAAEKDTVIAGLRIDISRILENHRTHLVTMEKLEMLRGRD